MAFTESEIENGSGKPDALVYGVTSDPVADAVAYLARRGSTAFIGLAGNLGGVPKQDISLLRGTEFVERKARHRTLGKVMVWNQRMVFPRWDLYLNGFWVPFPLIIPHVLPPDYLAACYIAADLHAAGEPLGAVIEDKRNVKIESIGGAISTEWFEGGAKKAKAYTEIDDLLQQFYAPAGVLPRG